MEMGIQQCVGYVGYLGTVMGVAGDGRGAGGQTGGGERCSQERRAIKQTSQQASKTKHDHCLQHWEVYISRYIVWNRQKHTSLPGETCSRIDMQGTEERSA